MFQGFPKDSSVFLAELVENNNKPWFQENKSRFKEAVEAPAKLFCEALLDQLSEDWDSKIFRIYRDLRFSKDKTPYNPYLRIGFTKPGEAGLFFSLESDKLILGSGMFDFGKDRLERYRERVAGKEGEKLASLLEDLLAKGYRIEEPELKRVPRGFDSDHERGDLLRRKSLTLWLDQSVPNWIYSPAAVANCLKVFEELADFRAWIKEVL